MSEELFAVWNVRQVAHLLNPEQLSALDTLERIAYELSPVGRRQEARAVAEAEAANREIEAEKVREFYHVAVTTDDKTLVGHARAAMLGAHAKSSAALALLKVALGDAALAADWAHIAAANHAAAAAEFAGNLAAPEPFNTPEKRAAIYALAEDFPQMRAAKALELLK